MLDLCHLDNGIPNITWGVSTKNELLLIYSTENNLPINFGETYLLKGEYLGEDQNENFSVLKKGIVAEDRRIEIGDLEVIVDYYSTYINLYNETQERIDFRSIEHLASIDNGQQSFLWGVSTEN